MIYHGIDLDTYPLPLNPVKRIMKNWNPFGNTHIYRIWRNMNDRCYNPKATRYNRYGAIGVTVCEEWRHDPCSFIKWAITHGYQENLSIDRIDGAKIYSPETCRWATPFQQSNNLYNNKKITYQGRTQTLSEWAKETGLTKAALRWRFNNGYTPEEAFSKPIDTTVRYYDKQWRPVIKILDGKEIQRYKSISDAAQAYGVTVPAIRAVLTGKTRTCKGFQWKYADK